MRLLSLISLLLTILIANAAPQYIAFQDTTLSDEQRLDDVIARLTLDEKKQLLTTSLGVERLGIPAFGHFEGLHGLTLGGPAMWGGRKTDADGKVIATDKFTTIFPQSYGLGCTWSPELVRRVGEVSAEEMRYYSQSGDGKRGALILRAPNADLARDPRWGRTEESFGEDPVLTAAMTVAHIRGTQGDNPRYWRAASLMKHFVANSNEDGRDSTSSNFSERLFYEYYSYPFYRGIVEGGSRAFMASYNAWNGIPMTVNPCLNAITRERWGNDGIICTDGGGYGLLMTAHRYYTDRAQAVTDCIKAGITQFLDRYRDDLDSALSRGLLTESDLDRNIRCNLRIALRLGLLDADSIDNPYKHIGHDSTPPYMRKDVRKLVREVTAKSVVLLKNDKVNGKPLLPFDASVRRIAVIGVYGDSIVQDWYSGTPAYQRTIAEALRAEGYDVTTVTSNTADAAISAAKDADLALVCIGNHPFGTKPEWKYCPVSSDGREAVDRQSLTLADEDLALIVAKANPRTVLVLVSSFPYAINRSKEHIPAILNISHCSQEQGTGLADVLTGRINPAGRTVQTWVSDITELPDMMDYDITHGRTYMYYTGQPLFPFGYGLSYTTFTYGELDCNLDRDGNLIATVNITNSGDRDGEEVVQLYLSYPESQIMRHIRQLEAFDRIAISAGETRTVTLTVPAERIGQYYDEQTHQYQNESTPIRITIGTLTRTLQSR